MSKEAKMLLIVRNCSVDLAVEIQETIDRFNLRKKLHNRVARDKVWKKRAKHGEKGN